MSDDTSKYETVTIDSLQHDPENARLHGDRNLDAIVASLERFGQQKPIVVTTDGIVVAGNGTLEAARRLGWETISVVRTTLTGAEARAFAIADNRTSELASWDESALQQQLVELAQLDEELLRATGFAKHDDMLPSPSASPPEEFDKFDESIETNCVCPKCGYRWQEGK